MNGPLGNTKGDPREPNSSNQGKLPSAVQIVWQCVEATGSFLIVSYCVQVVKRIHVPSILRLAGCELSLVVTAELVGRNLFSILFSAREGNVMKVGRAGQ